MFARPRTTFMLLQNRRAVRPMVVRLAGFDDAGGHGHYQRQPDDQPSVAGDKSGVVTEWHALSMPDSFFSCHLRHEASQLLDETRLGEFFRAPAQGMPCKLR